MNLNGSEFWCFSINLRYTNRFALLTEALRPHNLVCAFHAISCTRLGAASTFGCLSRLTRHSSRSYGLKPRTRCFDIS